MKELIEISEFKDTVSIASFLSLCATIFIVNTKIKKLRIVEWVLWLCLLGLLIFSVMLGFVVHPLPTILVVIVVVFLIIRYLLAVYKFISYPLLNILLLLGMEMAKDPGNTWGMGALPFGVLLIIFVLLLKLLDLFSYRQFYYNGIVDMVTGAISFGLIAFLGFITNEWTFDTQIYTRYGVLALSAILIIEGIIMFWKDCKNKTTANTVYK
ncbi:MAG: hypothetical protein KGV44_10330 [Flavobacteriaceae bacterium]|nr:hypothetical protein [Flavobacteriaceae bacterium]